MTEDRESEVLVRVFAQVMYNENDHWTADKGLSAVSVIKRKRKPNQTAITKQPSTTAAPVSSTTDNPLEGRFASVEPIHCNEQADNYVNLSDYEYRIVGSCTIDNKETLNCPIRRDLEYHKIMPTFHHWKTDQKRYGLSFETASDATDFDKNVRFAVEELLNGVVDTCGISNSLRKYDKDHGEDEVFMAVNLPLDPSDSRSSSDGSHGINFNIRRESSCSLKKRPPMDCSMPFSSIRKPITHKMRCRHCHELFTEESNERGDCEYAPDCWKSSIEAISGIRCASCMLYHCMSDSEGDFAHPCDCNHKENGCGKRWLGLTLLSFLVPCLWCYPPLKACHLIGISCGLCGGKHHS
ncbi:sprouty-related, EVH1 domain-containing protein 1 [Ctenocephalides felis]|uniref:sprouty-related, EVH1 domain-containing protein 1 n=1 Tax=Ctenocephalides felis TaxID=7515 RepID=UPI000E6E3252|nr:sprouty-related, EVH1 domain-containing protein 1 [Ctenocephalides felis]